MIHLLLFLYLLQFVSSQSTLQPTIIDVSPVLTKDVNETAELYCKVKNLSKYSILWGRLKTGHTITISGNGAKFVGDERISVTFLNNPDIAVSTLRITSLQHKDAGEYRCSVTSDSTDDNISRDVTLQVRSPPYILGNSSSDLTTLQNTTVTLECNGGGYPAPEVTWTRENNAVFPNGNSSYHGSVLKINNVRKEHAGNYYCSVNNNVGTGAKKTIHLVVEYPPTVKLLQERVGQAIGYEAQLECIIESPPSQTPIITWFKEGAVINDNQYYSMHQSAIDAPKTNAILKIKVLEKKLYGSYTCVAKNQLGKADSTIVLFPTDKEVCSGRSCTTSSGHSIISMLDLKFSFTSVIILMLNWHNM